MPKKIIAEVPGLAYFIPAPIKARKARVLSALEQMYAYYEAE